MTNAGFEMYIDTDEVARRLGVKPSWVHDKVRTNALPSYKLDGLRRFKWSEIESRVQQLRRQQDAEWTDIQRRRHANQ